jgi:hypothetical protein
MSHTQRRGVRHVYPAGRASPLSTVPKSSAVSPGSRDVQSGENLPFLPGAEALGAAGVARARATRDCQLALRNRRDSAGGHLGLEGTGRHAAPCCTGCRPATAAAVFPWFDARQSSSSSGIGIGITCGEVRPHESCWSPTPTPAMTERAYERSSAKRCVCTACKKRPTAAASETHHHFLKSRSPKLKPLS